MIPPTLRRRKNTWKLAIIKLLRNVMLVIPVIALFFTEHGLSLTQISLLQSIFSVALFSLEIPTGYISDRFGRKASLLCGNILIVIGYLVYRKMSTFRGFAGAEIILALGRACISGSDSALLYDTLKQAGKEAQAKKREGRIGFAGDIAGVIGGGIGGFLGYYFGFDILWLFSAMFVAITIPITRSLEEIRGEEHQHKEYHIINDAKQLYTQFRTKPRILWLILFTGILSYATYSLVRSQQQRLQQLGAPVAWFGIFWGIARLCVAGGGISAHKYDAYTGHIKGLGVLLLGIVVSFALIASGLHWSLAFLGLCLAFTMRGIQAPLTTYYVNEQTDSSLRATTLSSMSMIHRLLFALVLPLQGRMGDHWGLQTMFIIMLVVFALSGTWTWWKLQQTTK